MHTSRHSRQTAIAKAKQGTRQMEQQRPFQDEYKQPTIQGEELVQWKIVVQKCSQHVSCLKAAALPPLGWYARAQLNFDQSNQSSTFYEHAM